MCIASLTVRAGTLGGVGGELNLFELRDLQSLAQSLIDPEKRILSVYLSVGLSVGVHQGRIKGEQEPEHQSWGRNREVETGEKHAAQNGKTFKRGTGKWGGLKTNQSEGGHTTCRKCRSS